MQSSLVPPLLLLTIILKEIIWSGELMGAHLSPKRCTICASVDTTGLDESLTWAAGQENTFLTPSCAAKSAFDVF